MIHLADGKRTKLVNIENFKPYHQPQEKPVYNLDYWKEKTIQREKSQRWRQRGRIMFILKSQKKEKNLIQLSFPLALTLQS